MFIISLRNIFNTKQKLQIINFAITVFTAIFALPKKDTA